MKVKKRSLLWVAIVFFVVVCAVAPKAEAFEVFDPTNYAANSNNLLQSIQAVAYQYQQIQYSLQNLASMDSATAAANSANIRQQIGQLQTLQQTFSGLMSDYTSLQGQWGETYKDFTGYNGMTTPDFLTQMQRVLTMTNNTTQGAAYTQGQVQTSLAGSASTLDQLLVASQSSQGALSAAQAGNQIAAFNAQQMLILQNMIAEYNKAQLTYMQQQTEREKAQTEAAKAFYKSQDKTVDRESGNRASQ